MATLTIELPDGALSAPHQSPEEFVKEMRLAAAIHWYSRGEISQGKGAEIAGMTRSEFLDALARAEVDACQVTPEELEGEINRALQAYRERLAADLPDQGGAARGPSGAGVRGDDP